jgi:hypothetical protein
VEFGDRAASGHNLQMIMPSGRDFQFASEKFAVAITAAIVLGVSTFKRFKHRKP